MKCNRCPSQIELMWPENWKKGMKPIVKETGLIHNCIETPKNKGWKKFDCIKCGIEVSHNTRHKNYNPAEPCSECREK